MATRAGCPKALENCAKWFSVLENSADLVRPIIVKFRLINVAKRKMVHNFAKKQSGLGKLPAHELQTEAQEPAESIHFSYPLAAQTTHATKE